MAPTSSSFGLVTPSEPVVLPAPARRARGTQAAKRPCLGRPGAGGFQDENGFGAGATRCSFHVSLPTHRPRGEVTAAASTAATGWPGEAQRPVYPGGLRKAGFPRPPPAPPSLIGGTLAAFLSLSAGGAGMAGRGCFKHNASAEVNHRAAAWPPPGRASEHRGRGSSGASRGGEAAGPARPSREPGRVPGQGPRPGHGQGLPGPGRRSSATGVSGRWQRLYLLSQDAATPAPARGLRAARGAGLAQGSIAERGGGLAARARSRRGCLKQPRRRFITAAEQRFAAIGVM